MSAELRRFPRFDLHVPGTVELVSGETEAVEVDVVCVSCEGAGITVSGPSRAVLPGSSIILRFVVPGGGPVVLPARVVWAAAGKAGLRLRLGECEPTSRHAFGDYIAPLTKQALAAVRQRASTAV